jgi:glycerate dehydrogenase
MAQKMKIAVLDSYPVDKGNKAVWKDFEKFGNIEIYPRTSTEEILPRIKDAEIVLTSKVHITEKIMSECNKLKYIGELATGYNNIDLEGLKKYGIALTNVPAYSGESVAQLVFAHILNYCNNIYKYSQFVTNGGWKVDFCIRKYDVIEISQKNLVIIGVGDIGSRVARIAKGFNMNVIEVHRDMENLDEALVKADFISLHCPLNQDTKGLVNYEFLKKCKKKPFLINASRGPIINEEDLKKALDEELIAGAGLDVLSSEPPAENNVLVGHPKVFITPHVGWASGESISRLVAVVYKNLEGFINGKKLNRIV